MSTTTGFVLGTFDNVKIEKMTTGINAKDRAKIAEGLSHLLADTYTVYLKTHNYHWNVTGPMFNTLHLMFEGQYNELALAVDLIAERIRALGLPAEDYFNDQVLEDKDLLYSGVIYVALFVESGAVEDCQVFGHRLAGDGEAGGAPEQALPAPATATARGSSATS